MPKQSSLEGHNEGTSTQKRSTMVNGRLPFKPINATSPKPSSSSSTRPLLTSLGSSIGNKEQRNPLKTQIRTGIKKAKSSSATLQQQSLYSTLRARTIKTTTTEHEKDIHIKKNSTTHTPSSSSSQDTLNNGKKTTDPPSLLRRSLSINQDYYDKIGRGWLKQPTQQQKPKTKEISQYDRHIPNHNGMASLNYHFSKNSKETSQYLEHGAQTYREHIAEVVGVTPNQRILSFGPEPPSGDKNNPSSSTSSSTSSSVNNNHTKNLKNIKKTTTHSTVIPPSRRILTAAEKILDAPYMADDFYLNLLDWSSQNVVAVALDKSIYLWNADYGTIKMLDYQSEEPITSLGWETHGQFLAVGTDSGDTQIWDVEANTKLRSMRGHQGRVGVLSWNKYTVSSGARDGSIWHHDVRAANFKQAELMGHVDEVCGLEWRSDGGMLASGGNDNVVHLWDARSTKPKFTKTNHSGAVKAIAWCPWEMNLVATGGGREDTHIHFWNSSHGGKVKSVYTGSQVTSLLWSRHHKEIVSTHGYPKNQLTVWGYPALNRIVDIPGHDSRILHSALSPDGQVVATAAADENLKFWRIFEHDGKELVSKDRLLMRRSNSLR